MAKAGKELYVGSLSYDTTEYDLEKLFSVSGRVTSIHLITDPKTGQFKGCGYVRMSTEAEAKDAIDSLDGALLIDRKITVSIANPQKMKPQGGGAPATFKRKSSGAAKGEGTTGRSALPGKAAGAKASAPKPAAKPASASASASAASKAVAAKPATGRSTAPKAAPSKAAASRPSSSGAGFSKPAAKGGTSRSGKR